MKSQRLIITGLLLAILVLSSFPVFKLGIAQLSPDGKLLFREDFESYDVGSFPSAGGWELVWDGRGPSYQIVTDQYAHSGIKSLQLWGQDWWSAVAQRKFTSESAIIGFEASLLIESYSAKPTGSPIAARVMFWNKELAAWGKYYARIDFTYDGNITTNNINAPIFGTWTPKTWINVRLVLDRSTNKFDVWINDVLMGNDISVPEESQDTYNINAIAIFSDHAGVKVYYDDVAVFESPSEFKFEYWLPWSDNTWYNPSDIFSLIGFWILEDGTTIEIDTNHDGTVDASLTGNSGEYLEWGYATRFHQIVDGLNVFPPIGTLIRSNKPIAINYRFTSPDYGIYDDHTYAYSLIPSFLLGTDYYILTDSTLASILSTANNNRVFIDENNDGAPEQEITLNYGENYIYHNAKAGVHIYSDKPIAIVVVNWDPSFDTETYAYELYPTNMLSSEYSCPHPNPGIQYYQYLTDKCRVVIGSIYDQTSVNIDENKDGIPEFSQSLAKGQCYVYENPKAEARIYGDKAFYALYIFDAYARDPWAGVYRDYMYAYIIPPRSLSGKTFLMLDHYESYHVVFTSVNIFILEDGTEVYVDRGFDGTIDEIYQGNKGNVINIVSKLSWNVTKITSNKPVTAAYSWEGGWVGVSEAVWGFTLIPLDLSLPKIRAQIVSYSISSGEFKPGDQVSAQVTVKNIGEEPWTFYIGFSVQDPNGKWWDAPYKAITLNPNEEGTVTLYWTVPLEAPTGYYNARVAVWGGKEDDILMNLLDLRDVERAFSVTSLEELCMKYSKLAMIRAQIYGNFSEFFECMTRARTDVTAELFIQSFDHLVNLLEGITTVGLSDDLFEKVKAAIETIIEFKDWLNDVEESINTLIQQIAFQDMAGFWREILNSLRNLQSNCTLESLYWQNKELSGALKALENEMKLIGIKDNYLTQWYSYALQMCSSVYGCKYSSLISNFYSYLMNYLIKDGNIASSLIADISGLSRLELKVGCDVDVHLYDEMGRHTGAIYDANGEVVGVENNIPNVYYSGPFMPSESMIILIGNESGTFNVVIIDRSGASYNLTFGMVFYDKRGNLINAWSRQYPISANERQTLVIKVNGTTHQTEVKLKADIHVDPDTLNLNSKGKWITAYIELPRGYDIGNINITTILLNDTISVDFRAPTEIGDYDGDGIMDLMVKFNRTHVSELILSKGIKYGNVTLTVSGKLYDGTEFEGSDTIRVKMPGGHKYGRQS